MSPSPSSLHMQSLSLRRMTTVLQFSLLVFSVKMLVSPFLQCQKIQRKLKYKGKTVVPEDMKPMNQNSVSFTRALKYLFLSPLPPTKPEGLGTPTVMSPIRGSLLSKEPYSPRRHCLRSTFGPEILKYKNLGLRIKHIFHNQCF